MARPYKLNESYKFQRSLGNEPRELTTASGWNKTKRYNNNPTWENCEEEAVFDIKPAIIDFGPMLVEHTYRQNLTLLNKGNFIARARIKPLKAPHLFREDECIYTISGNAASLAPGCKQVFVVSAYGQKVGKFEHVLEIVTERNMYRIPIKCEVMDSDEHKERLEWVNLNKKVKNSNIVVNRSNRNDEVELIEYGDESVGEVYEGDKYVNQISNAYLEVKWDNFSGRLIIDKRKKYQINADESLDRKRLEEKYNKTFKQAKSKWTSIRDRMKAGKSAQTMFKTIKNSSINETGVEGGEVEEAIEGKEPNDDEIGREDEKEEGGVLKDEVAKPEQVA
jgi:hypothetical protein